MGRLANELSAGAELIRVQGKSEQYIHELTTDGAAASCAHVFYKWVVNLKNFIDESASEILKVVVLFITVWLRTNHVGQQGPGDVDILINFCSKALKEIPALRFDTGNLTTYLPNLSRYFVYAETLKQEAPHYVKESKPSSLWPQQGKIEFKDYHMRYREELHTVLKGLSFSVNGKEKIGIVGRTGAGKSSLVYALTRIIEPASGSIFIDEVDVSTIGLFDLRSQISIVPQDPILFEGTIRDNLDPKGEFTNEAIWNAVKKAHIENLLTVPTGTYTLNQGSNTSLPNTAPGPWIAGVGLEKWVNVDGTNFSAGQRQLISLCRAILWDRPILILDEATANIDSATDQIMQQVVRTAFKNSTVLTIAHRLNTVMDSDRILVIDDGKAAEFDTPANLLAQKDSHFTKLLESMRFNAQDNTTAKQE
ncbi:ATP-binding cassette glutathione S-conjugate transporter ycf1 [Coemansia sp. RSA 2607]|nr:ATP-binding cassette glutathione S-conjugate transporter ycf1 [Coemansia sp. RSA 2607]